MSEIQENRVEEALKSGILVRLFRFFEMAFIGLLLLVILLYLALQSSWVQNYLIQKTTAYLSTELATKVSLDRIDLQLFDQVQFEGLYVEDRKGDTLIYARHLNAALRTNLLSLLVNKLEFDEIALRDAQVIISRRAGERENNAQFIIDYFSPKRKKKKTSSPFHLYIKNCAIKDLAFTFIDEVVGQDIRGVLPAFELRVNAFDRSEKFLDIPYIETTGLTCRIMETTKHPLPVDTTVVALVEKDTLQVDSLAKPFRFLIGEVALINSTISYDNFQKSKESEPGRETMDFNHLGLSDLSIILRELSGDDQSGLSGVLQEISGKEKCGFILNKLSADTIRLASNQIALEQMLLTTPNTSLGSMFRMSFDDFGAFKHFNDDVQMQLKLDPNQYLGMRDLMYFSEGIKNNRFFIQNATKKASIQGNFKGKINSLKGDDIVLKLDGSTDIAGRFTLRDAAEGVSKMSLLCYFDRLTTNFQSLRSIVPGFNPPSNFDKLGFLRYTGNYDLIFGYNHIMTGDLKTDLGPAKLNMLLDMTGGRDLAQYSGTLNVTQFDLARWADNPELGFTDFNFSIKEGSKGLKLATLNTTIEGRIDQLQYKGYNYKNVKLDGKISDRIFDGLIAVNEKEIELNFNGLVNMKEAEPVYDFKADVRKLDLFALGFTKVPFSLTGKFDRISLKGNTLRSLHGDALVSSISYKLQDEPVQRIDSITLVKENKADGRSYMILKSSVISAALEGRFDVTSIHKTAMFVFQRNFPAFAGKFGIHINDSLAVTDEVDFTVDLHDSKRLLQLAVPALDTLRNISVKGRVDGPNAALELDINVPAIKYGGIQMDKSFFYVNTKGNAGHYELMIDQTKFGKGKALAPIRVTGIISGETLNFEIYNQSMNSVLKSVRLNGSLTALDTAWQVSFDPSDMTLFNDQWSLSEDNYIRFGKGFFETNNFELVNQDKRIILNSEGTQGLALSLTNFDLNFLDNILKFKDIRYSGRIYDFDARIENVFKLEGIEVFINTDTLFIRDSPYGFITGNFEMASLADPLIWKINVVGPEHRLRTVGAYLPKASKARPLDELGTVQPDEFQTLVTSDNFPFEVLSQFIPGISRLSGNFNTQVQIGGKPSRLNMNGNVQINEGSFMLDYLKSTFHIQNQVVRLSNDKIWADGDTIYDASLKNFAIVTGGLRHNHFKNWNIDCGITSVNDNFMILNTTEADNPVYYGQGIGRVAAQFSGPFNQTNINVQASAMKNSRLFLPIDSYEEAGEITFIKFVNPTEKKDSSKVKGVNVDALKGVQFDLDLSISPQAVVQLIMDKRAGDNVTGKGVGDISIKYARTGQFSMYGRYEITEGEYLFTLLNVFNKPFKVAQGGTINWYGDPYKAQVNLNATYDEVTSIATLLQNELQLNQNLLSQAQTPTAVNLIMNLSGDLFKPDISFDFAFPNLTGELKSLADNKLRVLRQDPNELNRQAFGLIVVGSFLPDNTSSLLQNSDYFSTAFNSVTQVLTGQLSNYISSLAYDWLGGRVSSINFNIAYNDIRNVLADQTNVGREVQVQLSSSFIDNRLKVQVGSQIGVLNAAGVSQDGFIGGDVLVEMQITKNRQWKVKFYNRTEPDILSGTLNNRLGAGLSFHKDYESFDQMLKGVSDYFKRK